MLLLSLDIGMISIFWITQTIGDINNLNFMNINYIVKFVASIQDFTTNNEKIKKIRK